MDEPEFNTEEAIVNRSQLFSHTLRKVAKEGKSLVERNKLSQRMVMGAEQKWLEEHRGACPKCGRTTISTIDHIIPKDILVQLGIDPNEEFHPENLQILCKMCNQFKANKLDFSNSKTKELLIKFLAPL